MAIQNQQRIIGVRGTKADVIAFTAALEEQAIGYATDTGELGIYTNSAWVWSPVAIALGDLTDVDLTGLANGDSLFYNSGTTTWYPDTPVTTSILHQHIINEDHSGDCDGSEDTFTTLLLFRKASTAVYLNGLRQYLFTDYNEAITLDSIVFVTPPETGDILTIDYLVEYNDFVSLDALLLETGFTLLLETGDRLLLE